MAPSTFTETIEQFYESSKEIQLTQNNHEPENPINNGIHHDSYLTKDNYINDLNKPNGINHNDKNHTMTPYDEALKRSNELKFMKPIRDWERRMGFITPILWGNTIGIITLHVVSILWLLMDLANFTFPKWQTVLFAFFVGDIAGFGVTAGAHRFWCHRSYKATWPLQLILLACYSAAGQNTLYEWVRDHRVHHKFSETTADPHDANRGFWFSHVGWLMMKKHPDVIREGQKIDLSDIANDPLITFHTRYFNIFKMIFCFALPCLIPCLAWNETVRMSLLSQAFLRYTMSLNFTWSVNSFAHLWGNKPYDRHIMPSENLAVSIVAMGEGWHNYHHTFPWDYKAAELGMSFNLTTVILDQFARIGWAYDLKTASPTLVKEVAKNRGEDREKIA